MRMGQFALLLIAATLGHDPDAEAAYADWERLNCGPYAYATVSTAPSEPAKERLAKQLAFAVCSLSHKSNLADQIPVRLEGTNVYRLDLVGLGWEKVWVKVLQERYGYRPDILPYKYPLVVRADWIVAELMDPTLTGNAAHLLLYGRELKTNKEFRDFWKVNVTPTEAFGFVEGESGVQAKNLQRLMVNYDTAQRTRFFETFDSIKVVGERDPIERPVLGTLKHDGNELIVGIQKHLHGEYGILQDYSLGTGNSDPKKVDQIVARAPVDLVKDELGFRGFDIINRADCITCHVQAMRMPTLNAHKQYIVSGAKLYADKYTQKELDRLYQSPFVKELERQNEDYANGLRLVNGLTPERNTSDFIGVCKDYDGPVSLSQAARELHVSKEDLRNAIAEYSPEITGRLAALAHGQPMSREQWRDENFKRVMCEILPAWRNHK